MVGALAGQSAIHIDVVFINESPSFPSVPLAWRLYRRWDSQHGDPFHLQDASAILPDAPHQGAALFDENRQLTGEERAIIAARNLDVLLWIGEKPKGNCRELSRLGVWRFSAGDPSQASWSPPYFSEAYHRKPIAELLILTHVEDFDRAAVIYRHVSAVTEGWHLGRSATSLLERAGVFLLRSLFDVVQFGQEYFFQRLGPATIPFEADSADYPASSLLLRYLVRQAARSVRLRYKHRGRRAQWFTAIRRNQESFSTSGRRFCAGNLHEIQANVGYGEADPFIGAHNGHNFFFFEEIDNSSGRGRISCRELQTDLSLGAPIPVLEPPYQISYPFLIERDAEWFMIPETSENKTVELYRCTEFPHRWRLEKILCEGLELVDTTAFWWEGMWFFLRRPCRQGNCCCFTRIGWMGNGIIIAQIPYRQIFAIPIVARASKGVRLPVLHMEMVDGDAFFLHRGHPEYVS